MVTRSSTPSSATARSLNSGAALEVGVDEGVEVTVQYLVHVGGLLAGTVVLDHLVWVENVGADLGSPFDVCPLSLHSRELLLPFLPLELEEARPQDPHCHLAVLVLAAFVLALDDGSRRQVCDPDGRVGLVDVLPPRSR